MTTIAYRKGVIAADSQATDGGQICGVKKLFLLRDEILGVCGDTTSGLNFVEWRRGGGSPSDKPKFETDEEFYVLSLTKEGVFWWDKRLAPIHLTDPFTAIGSGGGVAIGAMHMGASAKDAVKAAVRWDAYTGGKIVSYSVKDLG